MVPKNTELLERMRRKRMAADHFRGKLDWTALRGWDLALGAALITKAQALKAMNRYPEAIGVLNSLILKDSTNTKVLIDLAECYKLTGNSRRAEQALDSLLSPEGVWGRTPWVQQKADADPPTVYV